jgi:hypothetical protein
LIWLALAMGLALNHVIAGIIHPAAAGLAHRWSVHHAVLATDPAATNLYCCCALVLSVQDATSQLLSALSVVLDHPVLASDPLLLCSAAQVCSSWHVAVAASGAGTTDIVMTGRQWQKDPETQQYRPAEPDMPTTPCNPDEPSPEWLTYVQHVNNSLKEMEGLPIWLSKHAHLVRSMSLMHDRGLNAATVLNRALRPGGVAAGLQLPRLQRFVVSTLPRVMLPLLPDSLLELCVSSICSREVGSLQVLHECLQRLTGLQSLTLGITSEAGELDLSPLVRMVHLTELDIQLQFECTQVSPPQF